MIVTFYSYKGGVGRSMAVANVADLLYRRGLRVLMVDFDLEAPGLEHFFPVDHAQIRSQVGLLDLLLAFKYSMSVAAGKAGNQPFRDLGRFISSVYPSKEGGGSLDIMPAGRRGTDHDLVQYGVELRRFDWLDFYFTWSGELFFEWLRRECDEQYDVVLVDSRTGVTEMGGICAYQLADAVVVLCAPNLQNVEGTESMVEHFMSPGVLEARQNRPLDVLVVPARVEQRDAALRNSFRLRFRDLFDKYTPAALRAVDLSIWDLQIPYEPRFAFDEQVVVEPGRPDVRQAIAEAYDDLLEAIAQLAPPDTKVAGLRRRAQQPADVAARPIELRYDPRTRFASTDVSIFADARAVTAAQALSADLTRDGVRAAVVGARLSLIESSDLAQRLRSSLVAVVFVEDDGSRVERWSAPELVAVLTDSSVNLVIVKQHALDDSAWPSALRLRPVFEWDSEASRGALITQIGAMATRAPTSASPAAAEVVPFVGLRPFAEGDAPILAGREEDVDEVLDAIRGDRHCVVSGQTGTGKTSVVTAGLVPALRRGAVRNSDRWLIRQVNVRDMRIADVSGTLRDLAAGVPARVESDSSSGQLVILDQFESVIEQADRKIWSRVLDELRGLLAAEDTAVVVIASDGRRLGTEGIPDLASLFGRHVTVGLLNTERLRLAIEVPVQLAGHAFEPGLVDELLRTIAQQPGQLSLLQMTLQALWERRREGYLTWAAHRSLGGVVGIAAQSADRVVQELDADDRDVARRVFLQLINQNVAERAVALPRRFDDVVRLANGREGEPTIRRVIQRLADGRLVSLVARPNGELDVVLAHDGLAQGWPQLRHWMTAWTPWRVAPGSGFETTSPNGDVGLVQINAHEMMVTNSFQFNDERVLGRLTERLVTRGMSPAEAAQAVEDARTFTIRAPEDSVTDLSSIPSYLRWFEPQYGGQTLAAILHDDLIASLPNGGALRDDVLSDQFYRDMLGAVGYPWLRRWLLWSAVASRTRWAAGGFRRAALGIWFLLATIGIVAFVYAFVAVAFTGGASASSLFSASLVLPFVAAPLWGRQFGAALVASISAIWILPPVILAGVGFLIYRTLERIARAVQLR